jgi:hypothetical protein
MTAAAVEARLLPWVLVAVLGAIAVGLARTYLKPADTRWHKENPWRG